MLGNGDAAPAIARLLDVASAAPPSGGRAPPLTDSTPTGFRSQPQPLAGPDVRLAAVVALGRLGDSRGAPALERLSTTADPTLRAASIWALGRMGNERALPLLLASLQDRRSEVALAACTGLGRIESERAKAALLGVSTDVRYPAAVRRARSSPSAATADRSTRPRCSASSTPETRTSRWRPPSRSPGRANPPWCPACSSGRCCRGASGCRAPTHRWQAWPPSRLGGRPRTKAGFCLLLDSIWNPPSWRPGPSDAHPELLPVVRTHAAAIQGALIESLAERGDSRREALSALDRTDDGLALGALPLEGDSRDPSRNSRDGAGNRRAAGESSRCTCR